jgi:Glycosyltransferase family 6
MKIAILYICTGKYSIFWNSFFDNCEDNFLPTFNKKYFVFSDTLSVVNEKVELIYQDKLGWPFDTLSRFKMFASIESKIVGFDYVFFFNANTHFCETIPESFLFKDNNLVDLIVVQHPFFFWVKEAKDFPYERNKNSTAFVNLNTGNGYYMGGLNGGKVSAYFKMVDTLKKNIEIDISKNIIAKWHDESHLNKYIIDTDTRNVKVFDYNYGFPEGHDLPLKDQVKIQFLDKNNFGGHNFLREAKDTIPVNKNENVVTKRVVSFFKRILNGK